MHVVARRGLRFASKEPARFIAGRRHPSPRLSRSFCISPVRRTPTFPWPWTNAPGGSNHDESTTVRVWNNEKQAWEPIDSQNALDPLLGAAAKLNAEAVGGSEPAPSNDGNGSGDKDKNAPYGSALRRSMRNRKPKEIPPVPIPLNFLSWNVRRHKFDGPLAKGVLHITGKENESLQDQAKSISTASNILETEVNPSTSQHTPPSTSNLGQGDIAHQAQAAEDSAPQNTFESTSKDLDATEASTSADRDAILVKFYATLQECSLAYAQMEETYGPPGEELENWDSLPDKWSEMPNLATNYDRLAAEFEDIATQAFAAFPNGELARKVSAEPELGRDFAKHVNDLETALREDVSQATENTSQPPTASHTKQGSNDYFPQYSLNHALFSEVLASISAGLSSQYTGNLQSFASQKSHLKLYCPIDGGIYFLDKLVEEVATRLGADLTILDPQDLVEMARNYIREGDETAGNTLSTLGFDAAQVYNASASSARADEDTEGEEGYEEDMDREHTFPAKISGVTAIPLSAAPREMQNAIKKFFSGSRDTQFASMGSHSLNDAGNFQIHMPAPKNSTAQNNDAKFMALLETVVNANMHKREFLAAERGKILRSLVQAGSQKPTGTLASSSNARQGDPGPPVVPLNGIKKDDDDGGKTRVVGRTLPPKTIILIKDFKEMRSTTQGAKVVDKLVDIVSKRRQDGQQIMIVGTSSSADLAENVSFSALENLQGEDARSVFRTLVVTPDTHRGLYYEEERRRLREINGRHLAEIVNRLDQVRPGEDDNKKQDIRAFMAELQRELEGTSHAAYLEERVLSFDDAHRVMFTAMGQRNLDTNSDSARVKPRHIAVALDMIKKSDESKSTWAQEEYQVQNPSTESDRGDAMSTESRLKKLRKTCNAREKTLLRGVVNPENIQTTFQDVHAAPETIEALENLTTLSLTRPDAFKYGVLAKDKLSGLLLYGPPGTGKTLLARAVAKQSGATMLEVSGSDVYDMYVGEGEKNVRAVFSLAKKLAPCVVFIDEADAIFGSRGSGTNRTSHRELINQFLREWDGVTETNAFLMVATNRPFDLDDAALRRLPRRLLVDLPSEKDREAILGIHLKGEALDASVSLAKLAAQTPLYSGSDLKNLAVAAALAAVREENDEAARHTAQDAPRTFPERRVLAARHFDKAMEEISASVSEDMSSLGAIRKFDEKYGDRRGRRKKAAYGFSGDGVAREETAKVRT